MSEEVVFYSSPRSRGRTVHWMLEEAGAAYRFEAIDFESRDQKKPAFLEINPMGKVPAIVHRAVVVTETAAICAYLADAFPAPRLAPATDSPSRGSYYRWLFFGASCLEPALIDRMLSRPQARPSALSYGSYEDTVAMLERALAPGPYLLGENFSAADVYVGSQMRFGLMVRALEARPLVQAYLERLEQRPAYKRFMENNDRIVARMKKAD